MQKNGVVGKSTHGTTKNRIRRCRLDWPDPSQRSLVSAVFFRGKDVRLQNKHPFNWEVREKSVTVVLELAVGECGPLCRRRREEVTRV